MPRKKKIDIEKAFAKPLEVIDGVAIGFGMRASDMETFMPPREELPEPFNRYMGDTIWHKVQSKWFYNGLNEEDISFLVPKEGIDKEGAILQLTAIQRSWLPKHEHKVAAVAYLLSRWFEETRAMTKHFSKPVDLSHLR